MVLVTEDDRGTFGVVVLHLHRGEFSEYRAVQESQDSSTLCRER